jgi:hypothetical protein
MKMILAFLLLCSTALAEDAPTPWGTTSGSITFSAAPTTVCFLAWLAADTNEVTVDWGCVEKKDEEFLDGKRHDEFGAFAHVMKAVRDGTAKTTQ